MLPTETKNFQCLNIMNLSSAFAALNDKIGLMVGQRRKCLIFGRILLLQKENF